MKKLILGAAIILAAGMIYTFLVFHFGIGIACPFERITGYLCPGCGVSGMFLSMFRGDFSSAMHSNMLTFCLLPFYAGLGIYLIRQYLRYGYLKTSRQVNGIFILLIGAYIVFGIYRNIA